MPLKDASNLYFYEEDRGSQLPSQSYLVGLFRSARHSEVSAYGSPNWLCRLLQPRVRPLVVCDDASFVAAAYVEEAKLKRTELPVLHIRNIAAKEGYGPTLYASIIQLARDSRLDGVVPNQNPADILSGPKEIWRRFACDYKDQITLIPTRETVHREGWLNNVFALTGC